MKWNNPDLLMWLLALIPLLIATGLLMRRRDRLLARIAEAGLWPTLLPGHSPRRRRAKNLLRILALALAIVALARPQWGFTWEKTRQRGLDIIVALDTSKSMLAQDIKPNRLQQAKWGIRDLLNELRGDRIGLVAFAGDAFLQCPATVDYAAFTMMLDDVYAGIVPVGGTDLYAALDTALDKNWDRGAILDYAQANQWDKRVVQLCHVLGNLIDGASRLEQKVLNEQLNIKSK